MRIRLKFAKLGMIKFIGHLDLLRTIQRALQRSKMKVSYSQGFNPHPKMNFAIPLSLGITSSGEYIDIELDENVEIKELLNKLNAALPRGIRILHGIILCEQEPAITKIVEYAKYKISFQSDISIGVFMEKIKDLMESEEVFIEKKTKRQVKEVNIRPMIKEITIQVLESMNYEMEMIVDAGSKNNLKPELVLEAMDVYSHIREIKLHRVDLLKEENGVLLGVINESKI